MKTNKTLTKPTKQKCIICGKTFQANKYAPYQKLCKKEQCEKEYKKIKNQEWRLKNPNYFKINGDKILQEKNKVRCKRYRENNPDYFNKWKKKNHTRIKKYMREYMKDRRTKNNF